MNGHPFINASFLFNPPKNGQQSHGSHEWWFDQPRSSTSDDNRVYGYMDDHKRCMIQQWVECQAAASSMNSHQSGRKKAPGAKMQPVKAPDSISGGGTPSSDHPEPFEWLKRQGSETLNEDSRVLTHFKTVESSEESLDETTNETANKVGPLRY